MAKTMDREWLVLPLTCSYSQITDEVGVMTRIRCSSLPLITNCAQAQHAPEVRIVGNKDAADLGSAVHMPLANLVETGLPATQAELSAACDKWQVELPELEKLYRMGAALWRQVQQYFPAPQAEVEMAHEADGVILTGHADVIAIVGVDDGE